MARSERTVKLLCQHIGRYPGGIKCAVSILYVTSLSVDIWAPSGGTGGGGAFGYGRWAGRMNPTEIEAIANSGLILCRKRARARRALQQ